MHPKTIILFCVGLFIQSELIACDACGGMLSGGISSWNPMFKSNSIGLRHQFASFRTHHHDLGLISRESTHTLELNGRWNFKNKFFLSVFVPFVYNQQKMDVSPNLSNSGLSDIRLQAIVSIWEHNPDSGAFGHLLQLGMGVKLPNAEYRKVINQSFLSETMQLGTGALEYQLLTQYVVNWKAYRGIVQANLFIPTENPDEYKFGNRTAIQASILREWTVLNGNKLLLGGGLGIDCSQKNKRYGYDISYTGHSILNAQIQASLFFSRFSVSTQIVRPIYQNMNNGATQNNILTNFFFQFFI